MSTAGKQHLTSRMIGHKIVIKKAPVERDWPAWVSAYPTVSRKLNDLTDQLIELIHENQSREIELINKARELYKKLDADLQALTVLEQELRGMSHSGDQHEDEGAIVDTVRVKEQVAKRMQSLEEALIRSEARLTKRMDQPISRLLVLWSSIYGFDRQPHYTSRFAELYQCIYQFAGLLPPGEFDINTARFEMLQNYS